MKKQVLGKKAIEKIEKEIAEKIKKDLNKLPRYNEIEDLKKKCGFNVTMSSCCNAPVVRDGKGFIRDICSKCKQTYYPPKYGKTGGKVNWRSLLSFGFILFGKTIRHPLVDSAIYIDNNGKVKITRFKKKK